MQLSTPTLRAEEPKARSRTAAAAGKRQTWIAQAPHRAETSAPPPAGRPPRADTARPPRRSRASGTPSRARRKRVQHEELRSDDPKRAGTRRVEDLPPREQTTGHSNAGSQMQQHEDAMHRSAQEPTLGKTRSKPRVKLTDERPGARFRRNARKIEIVDHGTELMNGRKRRCVDYQELDASQKTRGSTLSGDGRGHDHRVALRQAGRSARLPPRIGRRDAGAAPPSCRLTSLGRDWWQDSTGSIVLDLDEQGRRAGSSGCGRPATGGTRRGCPIAPGPGCSAPSGVSQHSSRRTRPAGWATPSSNR